MIIIRSIVCLILASLSQNALATNITSTINNQQPQSNPNYQNGMLTIPSVDTSEQVSKYSDITFSLNPDGSWKLNSYKESGIADPLKPYETVRLAPIDKVDFIMTNTLPIQVFLHVSGIFPQSCHQLGQINYRLESNTFNIAVDEIDDSLVTLTCRLYRADTFETTFALPVFGLKAGTYNYNVNGKFSGSFVLDADNISIPATH